MLIVTLCKRCVEVPWVVIKYWLAHALRTKQGIVPLTNPLRFRMILEELGGMYIKLGQILAMRFDFIPLAYATELLNLLDRARPLPNDLMFRVFVEETGKNIEDVMGHLDERPIATASFAQVYKATYQGIPVVIKIQKPDLQTVVRADLFLLACAAWLFDVIGIIRAVSCDAIVQQLRLWIVDELNYTREAQHGETLANAVKMDGRSHITIPHIYHEYTTHRVLVQSYLDGYSLKQMICNDTGSIAGIDRETLTYTLLKDLMCQYFVDGTYHADPHPANLFAFTENRIGYIDFGIMGHARHNPLGLLLFIKSAIELDHKGVAAGFMLFIQERLGAQVTPLLIKDKDLATAYQIILEFIRTSLERDIEPITKAWHAAAGNQSLSLAERSSALPFLKMVRVIEKYNMKFPLDIITFIRALLIIDMVCLRCSSKFNMIEAAASFFDTYPFDTLKKQLESRYRTPDPPKENALRETEKYYAAKERFLHLGSILMEKYPSLKERLLKNTI